MKRAKCVGRVGGLAVGLGIGMAAAALPGVASADPFPPPFDPNNFAISIDGITLFQDGTAHAISGLGDFAIADGANSEAVAIDGFGDVASADGANSVAAAERGFGDFASADGAGSFAFAGSNIDGTTGNNFDFASALGTSVAHAGFYGSFDSASAVGDSTNADAGFGNAATPANFDFANAWANLTTATATVAHAEAGSNDGAFIVDPFGSLGSEATAGMGGNFDLAGVLGDDLNVMAVLSDFLFHIAPFF